MITRDRNRLRPDVVSAMLEIRSWIEAFGLDWVMKAVELAEIGDG